MLWWLEFHLFHQLANSAQPTREILSLQAKRDDLLSLDGWKHQSWLAAFSGQGMVSWALVDAVRELRFWSTSSSSSCPWGVVILCGVILSCFCCGIGFILGSIVFSSPIRKFLCQVLQLLCASWAGQNFGLDHRGRIAEYRRN